MIPTAFVMCGIRCNGPVTPKASHGFESRPTGATGANSKRNMISEADCDGGKRSGAQTINLSTVLSHRSTNCRMMKVAANLSLMFTEVGGLLSRWICPIHG